MDLETLASETRGHVCGVYRSVAAFCDRCLAVTTDVCRVTVGFMPKMTVLDVTDIVNDLTTKGITVWVDGGWCVEALVGRELREHDDLDIAVNRTDENALREWFRGRGYVHRPRFDETPWNFVFGDGQGREIDVHVFEFDERGRHIYGIEYPADSLTGYANLYGLNVRCVSPEWMFRFKTAYEPAPKDLVDVQALADYYGYETPPTYRTK